MKIDMQRLPHADYNRNGNRRSPIHDSAGLARVPMYGTETHLIQGWGPLAQIIVFLPQFVLRQLTSFLSLKFGK